MNLELVALIIGMSANLLAVLGSLCVVCLIAYRMGAASKTLDMVGEKIGRLDDTNGGGLARCTQHTGQMHDLDRRLADQQDEMHEKWQAVIGRLVKLEERDS